MERKAEAGRRVMLMPVLDAQGLLSISKTQSRLSLWTAVAERSGDTALIGHLAFEEQSHGLRRNG